MSALERSLAYAHTGNAKVLSTSLMHPLWLSRGIIDQGMPSLSSILSPVLQSTNVPVIDTSMWPDGGGGRFPAIASKRAQILTYGEAHYAVRVNLFNLSFLDIATYRFNAVGGITRSADKIILILPITSRLPCSFGWRIILLFALLIPLF